MDIAKRVPGMTTCTVCGRDFPILAENTYIARDDATMGLSRLAGTEHCIYDAIDCPHCGCQNILQRRRRLTTIAEDLGLGKICGEEDEEDGENG